MQHNFISYSMEQQDITILFNFNWIVTDVFLKRLHQWQSNKSSIGDKFNYCILCSLTLLFYNNYKFILVSVLRNRAFDKFSSKLTERPHVFKT